MKASDLRIGNYVDYYVDFFDVKRIKEVSLSDLSILLGHNEKLKEHYKPIPLTKEVAAALGFQVSNGGISYDKNKLSLYFGDTILSDKNGRTYWNSWTILERTPTYVHELQNLFFSLTGEELTFK